MLDSIGKRKHSKALHKKEEEDDAPGAEDCRQADRLPAQGEGWPLPQVLLVHRQHHSGLSTTSCTPKPIYSLISDLKFLISPTSCSSATCSSGWRRRGRRGGTSSRARWCAARGGRPRRRSSGCRRSVPRSHFLSLSSSRDQGIAESSALSTGSGRLGFSFCTWTQPCYCMQEYGKNKVLEIKFVILTVEKDQEALQQLLNELMMKREAYWKKVLDYESKKRRRSMAARTNRRPRDLTTSSSSKEPLQLKEAVATQSAIVRELKDTPTVSGPEDFVSQCLELISTVLMVLKLKPNY